jgi:CubicO group peptidase (beta-lactamase class C family)
MQQCLIDVTKTPFPKLLHDTVLDPLGMTHSTYDQPLPADLLRSAATPYLANYKPVPGGPHIYPELAAAGLWSTPSDLARYAIEIQRGLQGKSNRVLSQDMIRQMLTSGMGNWGLGIQIGGAPSNPFFTHGGVDEGFESLLVAYENTGEGAVVMTNARGGTALAEEIIRSIAVEYGWPDHQATVRTAVSVDPKILAGYAGTYEIGPNFDLVVTVEDGRLVTQATNQPKFPLLAESDTKFFPIAFEAQLEFVKDDQGKVTHVILHQNGRDTKAPRK